MFEPTPASKSRSDLLKSALEIQKKAAREGLEDVLEQLHGVDDCVKRSHKALKDSRRVLDAYRNPPASSS